MIIENKRKKRLNTVWKRCLLTDRKWRSENVPLKRAVKYTYHHWIRMSVYENSGVSVKSPFWICLPPYTYRSFRPGYDTENIKKTPFTNITSSCLCCYLTTEMKIILVSATYICICFMCLLLPTHSFSLFLSCFFLLRYVSVHYFLFFYLLLFTLSVIQGRYL